MNRFCIPILFFFWGLSSLPTLAQMEPRGRGTLEDPYQVETFQHLRWIATEVNKGNELTDKYFVQTVDLDFRDISALFDETGWDPIGGYRPVGGILRKVGFAGHYDGQGHKVSHLVVNRPQDNYQSLFGYAKGEIKNLTIDQAQVKGNEYTAGLAAYTFEAKLANCQVNHSQISSTSYYVAGLCAYQAWGSIERCSVSNSEVMGVDYVGGISGWNNEGEIISSSSVGGFVKASNSLVGGVTGYQYYGKVTMSYSTAMVSGVSYVGGLIGQTSHSSVEQSYAMGDVSGQSYVGGAIGKNESSGITDCYARGRVQAEEFVGGFAGYNTYSSGTISRCYSTGSVSGDSPFLGGFIGGLTGGRIIECYWDTETAGVSEGIGGVPQEGMSCYGKTSGQLKNSSTYRMWDFGSIWCVSPTTNDGYPHLRNLPHVAAIDAVCTAPTEVQMELSPDGLSVSSAAPFSQVLCFDLEGHLVAESTQPSQSIRLSVPLQRNHIYLVTITYLDGQVATLKRICQ